MEQILFEDFIPNVERIKNAIEHEINSDEYAKYLNVSENKDGSISIKAKSVIVSKVFVQKKTPYIEVRNKYADVFGTDVVKKHNEEWGRVAIGGIDGVLELVNQISSVFMLILADMCGERFGCCHRFEQCSDAMKCIHPNLLLAKACAYRRNLEAGKIFYGKNKNI